MGKTGKWIKNFLTGKKDKEKNPVNQPTSIITENPTTPISVPPTTPKEKRRWSFRRSSAAATGQRDSNFTETPVVTPPPMVQAVLEAENEQKKHAVVVAAATAAAADVAVAAAQAAAAMIRLASTHTGSPSAVEEAAATTIQSIFRSYLARKALSALKGLVKLQALVRGHLVRKQATATLRCMQALVTVQARARAQRIRMVDESNPYAQRQSTTQENWFRNTTHELKEENIKIVEMDLGEPKGSTKSRNSYSNHSQTDHRFSTHRSYTKQDPQQISPSPSPSVLTEQSPRASSGHFEDYSFGTAQSSPQYYSAISKPDPSRVPFAYSRPEFAESMSYEYPFFPNYMANTQSSRAKVRSHSAPKQRPADTVERPSSRRRASIEGRNVPRAVRMQRSSSHVGSTAQNYQYPWSIKLDRSAVSLKDSECGSNSTMLTNTMYCKSLVAFDTQGHRY